MKLERLALPLLGALAMAPAAAQTARKLLQVGDPIPGAPAGQTAGAIRGVTTNGVGGYALQLSAAGPSLDLAWGRVSLGAPHQVLFEQGDYFGHKQVFWELWGIGLDDSGSVAYSAALEPMFLADSLWSDQWPVALEGNPSPVAGYDWLELGYAHVVSSTGVPYFAATLTSDGVTAELGGLFLGSTPLMLGGDVIPGLPDALDALPVRLNYFDVSADGAHWVAVARLADGTEALVVDGQAHVIEGVPVVKSGPLPSSFGAGSWWSMQHPVIDGSGQPAFLASTTAAGRLLVAGDHILHAQGDVIDGHVAADFEALALSDSGLRAFYTLMLHCLSPSGGLWKPPAAPFSLGDQPGRLRANVTAGDFQRLA